MFDKCTQKYIDLLNQYGDLNLYQVHNINFLNITTDIISSYDVLNFYKTRYVCFLEDINIIQEKSTKLREILNTCVITFTPYDIPKITGFFDRSIKFNPVFNENEYVSINLGSRSVEHLIYKSTDVYTLQYLNSVKFISIDLKLNPNDYLINKNITEFILQCIMCGCMVNITDPYLISLLPNYTLECLNKTEFDYDTYVYCSNKILQSYSYKANINLINETLIGIFGNPYFIVE